MPVSAPGLGAPDVKEALKLQSTWASKHCQSFENEPSTEEKTEEKKFPPGASAPTPEPEALDSSSIIFPSAAGKFSAVTFRSRFGLHGLHNDSVEPYVIQTAYDATDGESLAGESGSSSREPPKSRLERLQKEVSALDSWVKSTPGQKAKALEGPEGADCKAHSILTESQLIAQEHSKVCTKAAKTLHALGPKARRLPEHVWLPNPPDQFQAFESLVTLGRVELNTSSSVSSNAKKAVHYKYDDPGGIPWRSCEESERLHTVEVRADSLQKIVGEPSDVKENDIDHLAKLKRRLEALDRVADDGALNRLQESLRVLVTELNVLESTITNEEEKKKAEMAAMPKGKSPDADKSEEKQPQDGDGALPAVAEEGKEGKEGDEKEEPTEKAESPKEKEERRMTVSDFGEEETPEHKIQRLYDEAKAYEGTAKKVEDFVRESLAKAPLIEEIRQFMEDVRAEEVKNAHLFKVLQETKEAAEKMQGGAKTNNSTMEKNAKSILARLHKLGVK